MWAKRLEHLAWRAGEWLPVEGLEDGEVLVKS
jgi:hypothetical protein